MIVQLIKSHFFLVEPQLGIVGLFTGGDVKYQSQK